MKAWGEEEKDRKNLFSGKKRDETLDSRFWGEQGERSKIWRKNKNLKYICWETFTNHPKKLAFCKKRTVWSNKVIQRTQSVTTNFLQTIRIIRTGCPLKRRTVWGSKKILCKWWAFVARGQLRSALQQYFANYPDRLYWLAFSQRRTSFCKWSWSSESKVNDDIGGVDNDQEE